jgi:HEAT repeat protein
MIDDYGNVSARGAAPVRNETALRELLETDDSPNRRDAALGLVDRADDGLNADTVAALGEHITADPDADVRQFAVEALGVAGAGTAAIEPALDDSDVWVRAEAVVALSRAGGTDTTNRLRDALDDDAGPVRRNALIALAKLNAIEPMILHERLKEDPHKPVREYAAEWLGECPGDEERTVTLLAAVLARDPAAFVRANAARSLGDLGGERAIEALESQGIADRSDDVQRAARRALATARGKDPDQLDLEDPPAPGGGPDTPNDGSATGGQWGRETRRSAPDSSRGNATRRTGRGYRSQGDSRGNDR